MSKISGELNAEMMKKAIHDSRAKLFAEIVRKTGSQQSVIDRAMQEIQFLRDHEGGPMDEEVIDILRGNVARLERELEEISASRHNAEHRVKALRYQCDTAWAQAHRLAHALECLIMDTKDSAIVSKWWDSAFGALEEYNKLKSGAEDAKGGAKMRKVGI